MADESIILREVEGYGIQPAVSNRDVTMTHEASQQIEKHASGNTRIEQGGVLVGDVDTVTGRVTVIAGIPATRAEGTMASLTFTHEAWDEVNEIVSAKYPDHRIVGWYHSHPDFGIFLSEYDMFIQKNFFSQPWQMAYVVDPIRKQAGFFGWESGKIVSHKRWTLISSNGTATVQNSGHGVARKGASGGTGGAGGRGNVIRAGFLALVVGLIGGYFIRQATSSTATPATPAPPAISVKTATLPVIKVTPGFDVLRSWTQVGQKLLLTVTVINTTTSTKAGAIVNCAPAAGEVPAQGPSSCTFVNRPLKPGSAHSFQFTVSTRTTSAADPWADIPDPDYLASDVSS
jgi:proteasome lid subunit RPN8/RPN11